jgi:hypothetical protein
LNCFHLKFYFNLLEKNLEIFFEIYFLNYFGGLMQNLKYIFFEEAALNKMEQCPLCCESQSSNQALAIHLKKIHPQRNTAIQIMQ